ncbi:MAG: cation diffusion facilitator family transporter [Alphaproteobacteria bacterium]
MDNDRLMRLAGYASVAVAVTLVVAKIVAWLLTGSVSLLSSMVDSMVDTIASLVNLLAIRQSLQPADSEHRFGHGKAEPLSGLAQAAFIGGSAVFLTIEAVGQALHPKTLANGTVGIGVMILSIVLTLGLVRFQGYVIERTRSVAISADSLHFTGDILINGGVILALVSASTLGWSFVDPLVGVIIAGYLLYNSAHIAKQSLDLLMDREFDDEERQRIRDIAMSQPDVIDLHDLRTRSSGPHRFIQLHLEMDRMLPLWKVHDIADAVELKLREAFPNAEVIIHQDPAGLAEAHPEFSFEAPGRTISSDADSIGAVPIQRV